MPDSFRKRCVVAYATRDHQCLWTVELPAEATVADAIGVARNQAPDLSNPLSALPEVPWDTAPVGIYGEPCERSARPREGDRIELYRPLISDPRDRRRERVRQARKSGRPSR
ncbi:MAG TPA: RnfH family protein [Steroidobacteraceae bacterium]|nr:RnfH family protein [Steroidobacteraceae bacterium]